MVSRKALIITGIVIVALIMVFLILRGNEDSWIKDSRGVWVKHGNPSQTPDYVAEQQQHISCAQAKFSEFKEEFNSQCLGSCGNYSVDIVNVPRITADDLTENQCPEYLNKETNSFIELDKNGNIVRIV